jgi:hypothetical protein
MHGTTTINRDGFIAWSDTPGKKKIVAATRYQPSNNAAEVPRVLRATHRFRCTAGEIHFIEIAYDRTWFVEATSQLSVFSNSRESGEALVRERHLILD